MLDCNDNKVRITIESSDKKGEAALATGEASLTLALQGRVPWEDGVGHAGLMQRATDGVGIGFGTGCASALVHSPNLPYSKGIGSLAAAIPVLKVV